MILSHNDIAAVPHYQRIISLVPSQTELLYELSAGDRVVGITKFCVHPPEWYKTKKRVGGTKNVDMDALFSLQPDLVIANKEENVREQVEAIAKHSNVWVTDVNDLAEATQMISDIGQLTGTIEKAHQIASLIERSFQDLLSRINKERLISSAYFIWKDPWMVAGADTFIDTMLQYCGLQNVYAHLSRYPEVSLHELDALKPGLILLSSEPYPFSEKHKIALQQQFPHWDIRCVDGEMFSWYGSRLLLSVSYFETLFATSQSGKAS